VENRIVTALHETASHYEELLKQFASEYMLVFPNCTLNLTLELYGR